MLYYINIKNLKYNFFLNVAIFKIIFNFKEVGWNGLVQDLINHNADMCVTSLKLNSERARDIDFSIPFLETGIAIVVKIRSGVLSPTAFLGKYFIGNF